MFVAKDTFRSFMVEFFLGVKNVWGFRVRKYHDTFDIMYHATDHNL